jgi:hypothetical protein
VGRKPGWLRALTEERAKPELLALLALYEAVLKTHDGSVGMHLVDRALCRIKKTARGGKGES